MSDLISRKMVVQYLQEQQSNVIIEKAKKGFVSDDVCDGMKSAVDAFMNFIVQVPSEEAVPVVHAHWEKCGYKWKCTNCGCKVNIDGTPKENGLDFCSGCGAKMEGGAE